MQSSRLQDVLAKATYGLEPKYCFYAVKGESSEEVGTSLIFTYDAGVEQDPRFSNINIGKLYLDRDNNLILASWPDPKMHKDEVPPMRKDALFTNVESFSMRFFCCKELPKSSDSLKPPERGTWTDVWDKEFKMQPQLVEISIKVGSDLDGDAAKTLVFACVIPRGFPTIEYGS